MSEKKGDHRGIQKPRGSETTGHSGKDLFIPTLWDIIKKEIQFINTQAPRFNKMWEKNFAVLNGNPHLIRSFKAQEAQFLESSEYKIQVLKALEVSLIDGYYTVKDVVITLYKMYFNDSDVFKEDFDEDDRTSVIFKTSDVLIGSLLQFLSTERDLIPLIYLIAAKNKSILRLKARTDVKILNNLRSSGFEKKLNDIHKVMDELESHGYIEKTEVETNEENGAKYSYKWVKGKDFTLSEAGEKVYKSKILPIVEWCIGLWRSMYNIRELDVVIPEHYKWRTYLEQTVKKAATQGFMTTYWVIKNVRKYYEMLVSGKKSIN